MHPLGNILFLDVETVSIQPDYAGLDPRGQALWRQKTAWQARAAEHPWTEDDYARQYADRAAIFAEFGKVIVISAGVLADGGDGQVLRIKSFAGDDEAAVLQGFADLLEKKFNNPNRHVLCGHNIKEFDIPYLCRRMMVNEIPLPTLLQVAGKKPWEIKHLADTFELWKFGDMKNFTSLDLLAYTLGIPSPKENMDGSMVGHAYWAEQRLDDIRQYCERDVLTVAQVFLRFQGKPLLEDHEVVFLP